MIWASVAILALVVIILVITLFLALQGVSQTLSNALSTLERVHSNDGKRIDQVLDRLMAMDFESFKNYQLAEDADVGGIEDFEEPTVKLEGPGIGREGLGADDLAAAANERRLILEDFGDDAELVGDAGRAGE